MIGLDTNVLVRYLAQDEPRQAALATRLIERRLTPAEPGFVSLIVLAELCWVLKSAYAATEEEIRDTVEGLLGLAQLQVQERQVVQAALLWPAVGQGSAGFVDVLVAQCAMAVGCAKVETFDKRAVRTAGMTLLA